MLTPQQIEEMNKITGLSSNVIQQNRLSELKSIRASQPVIKIPEKRTLIEKVTGFTGGEKIAQGLGQILANPKIAKEQEKLLNDAIAQQGELLKRKKEIEALGGDTTAIDKGLAYNKQTLEELGGGLEQLLNQKDLTGKQVIGSGLQLAGTIASAGVLKGAKPGLLKGTEGLITKATTAGRGAISGLKAGSTSGAIYGGVSGVSKGLIEDKNALEIAKQGIGGAISGAILGGTLGAVTGGITGKIRGKAIAQATKKKEGILDLVSPKQTTEYKIQAQKEGRISEAGLLKASKILPSKYDKKLAEVVKGVIDPKFSPQQNINLLNKKVGDINTGVKAYVEKNKTPFNTVQLSKKLNKGKDELSLIFAGKKQEEKTYNAVVNEFLKYVEKKDTKGLLDARQKFDKVPAIKKLLESEGLGENTKKQIVKEVRKSANEYIAELLPKDNKYREALLNETLMIDVMDNIAEKNIDRIGRNKIQYLVKKYPWLKAATYFGLGAIGTSVGIGAIGAATGRGE